VGRIKRSDGAEIHWEERGAGPLVVLANYWSAHPAVFEPVAAELANDHRVVTYDDRGTGRSTRSGPYDLDTAADDLAAVIDAAGGPAVIVSIGDGANRGVRVAAGRPELIEALICVGTAPLGRDIFAGSDVLASSETVVGALVQQVATDYRGALRSLFASTNPQMGEDDLRRRVSEQLDYAPRDPSLARLQAWIEDHPLEHARAAGGLLWVLTGGGLQTGWLPTGDALEGIVRERLPDACMVRVDDGIISRPDQTAAVVRRITARAAAASP
jgi:pimeloyl-ACP methyl ester carboxylesterase